MNNTHFNQIKYNRTIIENQKKLLSELEQIQKQLSEQQENCDHIRVCIGWNGPYLYRDTSICNCLICGKKDPESNYRTIEAYDYKSELYSHGELESYRNERMSELQNLALNIIDKREDITPEQLVEIMSDIIKNPIVSKEELEIISQRKKEMDDERNRLFEAAERPSTVTRLKVMKKTLKRNKKSLKN
jgi:hypothetical protein